jgi:DNA-binding NarL/FixJ family response regulator
LTVPDEPSREDIPYDAILASIVKRFMELVGPSAALNVARRIPLLSVDDEGNVLSYDTDDPLETITALIYAYQDVFGEVAVTLSRQAAQPVAGNNSLLQETGLTALKTDILLVDDHVLFRESLASLLAGQPDMKVAGQAGSVQEAIKLARKLQPHIILMDISLPDGTGLEATRAILAERPGTRIVFLTVHEEDEQLFAAIRAGAKGYLNKNVRPGELLKRLRDVARDEAGISPAIARRILEEFSRTPAPSPAPHTNGADLSAREIEIVRELARGATNREIARKLVISENTVRNHVSSVLSKLHLRSRRDIADYVREHGLHPRPPSDEK